MAILTASQLQTRGSNLARGVLGIFLFWLVGRVVFDHLRSPVQCVAPQPVAHSSIDASGAASQEAAKEDDERTLRCEAGYVIEGFQPLSSALMVPSQLERLCLSLCVCLWLSLMHTCWLRSRYARTAAARAASGNALRGRRAARKAARKTRGRVQQELALKCPIATHCRTLLTPGAPLRRERFLCALRAGSYPIPSSLMPED